MEKKELLQPKQMMRSECKRAEESEERLKFLELKVLELASRVTLREVGREEHRGAERLDAVISLDPAR